MKPIMKLVAALLCVLMLASCTQTVSMDAEQAEASAVTAEPAKSAEEPANATALPEETEASAQWAAVTVTDDLNREVVFETEPKRVAVLMGSFAETWLLAGGTLVAAPKDAWEDFDLGLSEAVVNLGSYQKVSTEALFDLDADLIIASANTKSQVELKETLESAKVNVLYFNVNGFEDYLRMLKVCTDITGRADLYAQNGEQVKEQVDAAKAAAADALNGREAPRVLFVRTAASGIHVKGSDGTVLGLMLKDLGCINIADGSDLLENLSIEKIIEEDPDEIFIVMQGSDAEGAKKTLEDTLTGNAAWAELSAVKSGHVHYMDKKLYHLKPNSRWGTAYAELEKLLYEA